ncbi:MAG: PAS domain-containing protein [Gammaproteobacteria bacterium]|nr:PAS domain-containing protein [Gammaproteobacteria bacterium]
MREQDTFASRLTQLIREHNISHAEIGRVVGVSGQAVGKWAKGGNIEYDNLKTVATHFDVNWIWLRYGDDAMTSFSERRTGSKVRRGVIKSIIDNEQRMRLALEVVTIGTWDFDIVDDEIVLSDVAEKLLGVGKNGFRGNKNDLLGYVATADRTQVGEALNAVIESREANFDVTHSLTHSAGRVRQRGKMVKDDVGRPVRIICVITAMES